MTASRDDQWLVTHLAAAEWANAATEAIAEMAPDEEIMCGDRAAELTFGDADAAPDAYYFMTERGSGLGRTIQGVYLGANLATTAARGMSERHNVFVQHEHISHVQTDQRTWMQLLGGGRAIATIRFSEFPFFLKISPAHPETDHHWNPWIGYPAISRAKAFAGMLRVPLDHVLDLPDGMLMWLRQDQSGWLIWFEDGRTERGPRDLIDWSVRTPAGSVVTFRPDFSGLGWSAS